MPSIKVIIPNAGMTCSSLEARRRFLGAVVRPDTKISVSCIEDGPGSIESHYDACMAGPWILKQVEQAEKDGFSAIVLYCMNDPAIDASRELVTIPVIAAGETSLHLATMLGSRFTFLTVIDQMIPEVEAMIQRSQIKLSCLASVRSLNIPVAQMRDDLQKTKEIVIREGRKAVQEDRAHVLVLGCFGLAGLGRVVQEALGIPVVDPAFVSIATAELLIHSNLAHSKITYPHPPIRDSTSNDDKGRSF